ncbi:Ribonuclease H, partial [Trema orientale]
MKSPGSIEGSSLYLCGASVAVECKYCKASKPIFGEEVKIIKHGDLKLHLPFLFLTAKVGYLGFSFIGCLEIVSEQIANRVDIWLDALEANFSTQVSQLWRSALVTAMWVIWTCHNKRFFDNDVVSINSAITFIWRSVGEANQIGSGTMRNSLDEFQILHCLHVQAKPPRAPRIVEVRWQLPPAGWLKVNTDGSAFGSPGLAGCGGIFRTSRGFFKGAFAIPLGKTFAFEAELAGAIHAILYAYEFGWTNLWLECDSTYLVTLLRERSPSVPWRWKPSWLRCMERISRMNFRVSHIFREGNAVADISASRASSFQTSTWWHSIPSFIQNAFSKDYMAVLLFVFLKLLAVLFDFSVFLLIVLNM